MAEGADPSDNKGLEFGEAEVGWPEGQARANVDILYDIAFPRTDAGVFAQLGLLAVVFPLALWPVRSNKDLRLFVIGVGVFLIALMGLRGLH